MTLQEFYFLPARTLGRDRWIHGVLPGSSAELSYHLWWVGGTLLTGALIPLLVLLALGMKPSELGCRFRASRADRQLYLALFLLILPVIWLVSLRPDFRASYPLFRAAGGPLSVDSLVFEAAYCLQFFAVEFFFRGVLVLGLKPALGPYAVLTMLAPYCMLHFHKPFAESLGAIVAGAVLGTLAYRSETILYGWFLHYAVALTMDCLAWRN